MGHRDKEINRMKRLLLICPFFAPMATPRSIRWYYFSRYLAQKGFLIDILAADPNSLNFDLDKRLGSQIHEYVRVRYINGNIITCIPGKNQLSKRKVLLTIKRIIDEIRGRIYYPDGEMFWALKTYNYITRCIHVKEYDYVITVSNPLSSLLVGYELKKRYKIQWICDLGDPWTFNPFLKRGILKRRIDRIFERKIIEKADKVVVTTEQTRLSFIDLYPQYEDKFVVISQGYDSELYNKTVKELPCIDKKRLNLVYTGRLYDDGRDGLELLYALKELGNYKEYIHVLFAGRVTMKFKKYLKRLDLEKTVSYIGHLPLNEVISLQKSCDILLQFGNDSRTQLPGKIFEYIGAKKPILVIYYQDYDLSKKMVEEESLGLTCINERRKLSSTLIRLIKLWENNQLKELRSKSEVLKCDWASQADCFFQLLHTGISPFYGN